MQVSLLANTTWLDEELIGFRYLTVGLIDEQVRVAQVVPDDLPVEDAIPFGDRVAWSDSPWSWMRRRQLANLAPLLEKLEPDVLHVLHQALWAGGLDLAEELESSVVLQVSGEDDVIAAVRMRDKLDPNRVAFSATTSPVHEALVQRFGEPFTAQLIRPGVKLSQPQPIADKPGVEPPLCALICGHPKLDANYQSLFAAIKSVCADHPEVQFFFDAPTETDPAIWQAARKLGILSNLSMVPHRLGHRELELGADVIIHPQPLRRSRSITLQAMAQGLPVIAHQDAWLDYLIDDQTAWIIDKPDAKRWEEMIRHLIVAPDQGDALGARAREWVSRQHLASQQVADTIKLYRRLTGEALKFPG